MKLIESSVQIIEEKDPYKMIELAGRTCYKSEDKITENSAKEFVDRMIKLGHGAMLEHGTIYLTIDGEDPNLSKIQSNPHTKVNLVPYEVLTEGNYTISYKAYITTNLRVLVENNLKELLCYQVEPTEHHEKRITAKFICDRGVSHEFVRHRVFSFAQESTRYCDYSKDKFGNDITYIIPSWLDLPEGKYSNWDNDWCDVSELKLLYPEVDNLSDPANCFLQSIKNAEYYYFMLINRGWKPQQARQVLPNATKTELVMTGFESDWEHFFELRCSGAAHPDAKKLADELKSLMNVKNIELNSVK
ncbi:FAD-dependent thymidylate synthase [Alistipes finegoldii]|jgi:thymidylate synthase (FAD)|uniref:Thymidylate synthase complementing protein n=1 Tax=Podoviridae sp. ctLPy3 TaxID=2825244 RepID=A0A8S5UW89_9CAUD|nr:MAG TPA: Thymidylate synthase complementing protein [Podoviridae sp. ctLPy3]DAR70312.1 MAG TPA: Thymidylate synthase complementing protein [Caudoviricetes sp.]